MFADGLQSKPDRASARQVIYYITDSDLGVLFKLFSVFIENISEMVTWTPSVYSKTRKESLLCTVVRHLYFTKTQSFRDPQTKGVGAFWSEWLGFRWILFLEWRLHARATVFLSRYAKKGITQMNALFVQRIASARPDWMVTADSTRQICLPVSLSSVCLSYGRKRNTTSVRIWSMHSVAIRWSKSKDGWSWRASWNSSFRRMLSPCASGRSLQHKTCTIKIFFPGAQPIVSSVSLTCANTPRAPWATRIAKYY